MSPPNGFRPRADDAPFMRPLACRCGSDVYDVIPRARLAYHCLKAGELGIMPAQGFKCSNCGEILAPLERIKEIRDGEEKKLEGAD